MRRTNFFSYSFQIDLNDEKTPAAYILRPVHVQQVRLLTHGV